MNNTSIAAAKPGDVLWDRKVKGLHVRCFGTAEEPGKKVFYLAFRTKAGKQCRPKIGNLGTFTLATARDAAREMLEKVAVGRDPMTERRVERKALTMDQLCDRYIEHVRTDPREKKKSAESDAYYIDRFVRPRWRAKAVTAITREDIEDMVNALSGTPTQANRVRALVSRMFNLAERWRVRPEHSNPCRLVGRYVERKRRRIMSRDEAPAIAAQLRAWEARSPNGVLFIYLGLLTGARPDEIARATWNDIRIERIERDGEWHERWAIVHTIHKTDDVLEERVIALPARAVEMLRDRPRTKGPLAGIGYRGAYAVWRQVREAAGCPDLTMYDLFRRTFASAGLRAGYTLDQIGQGLGHTSVATTRGYAWLMDDIRSDLAGGASDVVAGMLAPKTS